VSGWASFLQSTASQDVSSRVQSRRVLTHHYTAFAEELPVLHIVGQQQTKDQEQGLNRIHTLGDGKYVWHYSLVILVFI
jgi:hypothetical protein